MTDLKELVPDLLWVKEHPVRLAGGRFLTRMTVLRIDDGLCLHSPVEIDAPTRAAIARLGPVTAIVAPSTFHHFFVAGAQQGSPRPARTPSGASNRSAETCGSTSFSATSRPGPT